LLQRSSIEHFFTFEFEHSRMKFSWNCVKGFGSILLSQSVDRAVEEFVLQNNKQPIRKPSDKLRQDRPKIFFPQVKLADLAVPPPGEDLHMVKLVPYEPPPLLRTESVSSKESDNSQDMGNGLPSVETTTSDIKTTPISATPTGTKPSRQNQTSFVPSFSSLKIGQVKLKKKQEEDTLINPTFLSNDDL
jgi:hypothetical protein